jgi:hypothetical protein
MNRTEVCVSWNNLAGGLGPLFAAIEQLDVSIMHLSRPCGMVSLDVLKLMLKSC